MKKQTAANNELLTAIKKIYNTKIFKRASEIINEKDEADCLSYVNQFVKEPYTASELIAAAKSR